MITLDKIHHCLIKSVKNISHSGNITDFHSVIYSRCFKENLYGLVHIANMIVPYHKHAHTMHQVSYTISQTRSYLTRHPQIIPYHTIPYHTTNAIVPCNKHIFTMSQTRSYHISYHHNMYRVSYTISRRRSYRVTSALIPYHEHALNMHQVSYTI